MKIYLKDARDRYLKLNDMDMVFTYKKEEAFNVKDVENGEFSSLKEQLEVGYGVELETIFE